MWPRTTLSGDWDFISVSVAFSSKLPLWDDEKEGSAELLLELCKEVKSDVQELITLDALFEVSKSIVWSPGSEDPSKKNHFCVRICLPYL